MNLQKLSFEGYVRHLNCEMGKAVTEELFTLRPAREGDLPSIRMFAYLEGMGEIPSIEGVTVAISPGDDVVGFIRISREGDGPAHVNPVVVYETWRGYGVGRALVEDALEREGELRLVARGESIDFYKRLGFCEIPHSEITPSVSEDCDHCDMREECGPLPMAKRIERV